MSLPQSLRDLMAERPVLGTFLKIPRFEIVDVLALSGFDFVVCDYEHSQMSVGEACDVVRAGRARGLPVLVRVPALDRGDIDRLLEAGAAGIQLARGSGAAAGRPSVSLAQPAADYGMGVTLADHFERSNSTVLAVGQFETADYTDKIGRPPRLWRRLLQPRSRRSAASRRLRDRTRLIVRPDPRP